MAGLIDVGIIKPELATSFATGYRQAEEQRNRLAGQAQEREMNQFKLDQIKQDRAAMQQLQQQLLAAGKDPDMGKVFDALIATGKPEYVIQGIEGRQRLKAIQDFDTMYGKDFGGGAGAAVTAPAPANAMVAPGMAPAAPAAPVNAMVAQGAAPAPAPVNAMAMAPEQYLRQQIMKYSASTDPRAKAVVKQYEEQLKMYEPTEAQRNYRAGVADPAFAAWQLAQKRAGATSLMMPPQERAEQGERGKMLVADYSDIAKAAKTAARTLPAIEANLSILDKGFDTGFGTEAKTAGAKVLGALGVADAEKYATNSQTFLANASSAVLQKQLDQKGPQTEADAQRITQTGAQLGNTKDANKFLLNVAKAQIKRDIEQRDFYDKWWKSNKTYDGAEDAWFSGEGAKSLFDRPELKAYSTQQAEQSAGGTARKPLSSIFKQGR